MKNQQKLTFMMVAFLVVIVGLSVAYAALSTTLNITVNKVTENALTWDVAWKASSPCTLVEGGTSSTGRTCGAATASGANLTIADTTLSKPGDYCRYTCTIQNNGGIVAKFNTATPTVPTVTSGGGSCSKSGTTITCKNSSSANVLTYKIGKNSDCSTALSASDTIAAKSGTTPGSFIVYVCIDYASNTVQSTAQVYTNAKYTLVWNQN